MNPSTIQPSHLNRLAVVYVRQSTPVQVEQHPESRLRQYQLADRAKAFGWPAQRCLVIDDDLGLSGAQSSNRPGYQRLVSLLALREVGIVFGLEVSRLARNCLDWYQLLELAATFSVLIGDPYSRVLNTLNSSARNCAVMLPLARVFLKNDIDHTAVLAKE